MNKKKGYLLAAMAIIVLLFVCSGKFLWAGFAALFLVCTIGFFVWAFGIEKARAFFNHTKETAHHLYDELKTEEKKAVVDGVAMAVTKKQGWYQIVVVAGGKSWLLKPVESTSIPISLKMGAKIIIRKTRHLHLKGVETKKFIVADDDVFEVDD